MRKIILLLFFAGFLNAIKAQNSFSFKCSHDTSINCTLTCYPLSAKIPDIRISNTYVINPMSGPNGCYSPYVDPGGSGTPTSLTIDDKYSNIIDLGFQFPFFGTYYTQLIASTNGFVSFDISKAGAFSHYGILNGGGTLSATTGTPENLPSPLFDKALIMGPYHDLDPAYVTSPTQKIQYNVVGVTPYRKWVLSFFKVPLFSTACQNLIENTHQIVLYESLGIVEVFINDKQICTGWNQGRAMIGMQDFNRTSGILVPGRAASDAPWGNIGMNESWRFTPGGTNGGVPAPTLFRKVELYTLSNVFLANGDTSSVGNGIYNVNFPTVCPPPGTNTFVVKSYYKKYNDTTVTVMATDTFNVIRNAGAMSANTTSADCVSGNGTITVTSPVGPTFEYSVDGITWQASNVFAKPPGTYTVYARIVSTTCASSTSAVINSTSTITATATTTNSTCSGAATGSITVNAANGQAPYTYSINGGVTYQTSNVFTGLAAGSYTILIRDAGGCTYSFRVNVGNGSGITASATTTNASCSGSASGTITVTASNGTAPYTYSLNGGPYQSSNVFTGLTAGNYLITVKDANGCTFTFGKTIGNDSGVSGNATTTNASCAGSNSGSINVNVNTGIAPFTFSLNGGAAQSSNIFNNLAPGTYTVLITDAGGCTFSFQQSVGSNAGVSGSATATNAGCPGSTTGSINVSVTVNTGTAPYTFSLNGGAFQTSNIFNNLVAGIYTITIKDAGGCTFSFQQTVGNNPLVSASLNVVEPSCFNQSNGSITVTPSLGTAPYQFALNAGAYQTNNVFNNVAAGNYVVHTKDATGCIKDTSITINQPALLTAIADTVAATCAGGDGTITVTATGGTAPYQYSKNNGTTFQSSNVFNVNRGTYTILIKDSKGCTATVNATISLNDNMFLDLGADKTVCAGSAVTLTSNTNAGTNIFNWSPATGLSSATSAAPAASPNDTTKYFLTAQWGVCQRSDSITVNVLHKPIANAGADTIICDRTIAFLRGSATNLSGSVKFSWSPANELSNPNSYTTTARPTTKGPHTYTLEVDDSYGCNFKVYSSVVVTMNPPVPAFAGNDTIAVMGLPHQLFGSGGVQYLWSPANVLDDATKATPVAILRNDTRFTLLVTDNGGCLGFDTVFIKVYKGPTYYVPNAFTPNGDGLNDVFRAIPPGIVKTEYFRIFNRWGQLVFETHEYMKGWDGTYLGKAQPNGAYVWVIKGIDKFGKMIEMKGIVMMIR